MSEEVVFALLIKDHYHDLLLKEDYVKQVYDRVLLERILNNLLALNSSSDDSYKVKVIYCISKLFSTIKQDPNAKFLLILSKLFSFSLDILISINGKEEDVEFNEIKELKHLKTNKQIKDFLLVNFTNSYKELIYELIIKEKLFEKKDPKNRDIVISQLQTDHSNIVSNLLDFFRITGIDKSVQNDLALIILIWNFNKPIDIYNEFVMLLFIFQFNLELLNMLLIIMVMIRILSRLQLN
jgi:hypothetical protein